MTKQSWLVTALVALSSTPVHAQSTSAQGTAAAGKTNPSEAVEASSSLHSATEHDEDSGAPPLFSSVHHVGGYGGASVMYSRIAGKDGVLVGGEGAVLLDHRLALGGAGYGWTRDTRGPADVDGVPRNLEVGYGGFLARYSVLTGGLIYGSLGALVGAGATALRRDSENELREEARADASDSFFVFEPQLSVQVNLLRWMRIGVQGGYRITSGLGHLGYTEKDIDGLTLGGTLQFGGL
jgi:hypothetical protein